MTHYDEPTAMAEGWLLSQRADGLWEIQRYDDATSRSDSLRGDGLPPFTTDDDAEAYVREMAEAGSRMHAEALKINGTRWLP